MASAVRGAACVVVGLVAAGDTVYRTISATGVYWRRNPDAPTDSSAARSVFPARIRSDGLVWSGAGEVFKLPRIKPQRSFDAEKWRPQSRIAANITSLRQLQVFNDRGGIAVDFDVRRSVAPQIAIDGSQNDRLSFWETRSASGFVTKPKFNARLFTIRFVTNGRIAYHHRTGEIIGSPTHATIVGFEDLREVQASTGFHAFSGTMAIEALLAANEALPGGLHGGLEQFAPVAEMTAPGMQALFWTLKQIQHRSDGIDQHGDLFLPLLQEIVTYQLLSAWPRRENAASLEVGAVSPRNFQAALDYIEAHLSSPLTLADIAAAAGISVRSLQDKFRRRLGRTPIQLIADRRLQNVHQDLVSAEQAVHSITEIARRWGFVHMSDFSQRYRRSYGCSPSQTRRDAARAH